MTYRSVSNTPVLPQPGQHSPPLQLPRPRRRWLKWVIAGVSVLLITLAAAGVAGYFWYQDALTPLSGQEERISIDVGSGATLGEVTSSLEEKGLIRSGFALSLYARFQGAGEVQVGSYIFSPNQSPIEILQWIQEGRVDTFKITILPGQTLTGIKETLREYGYSAEAIETAFAKQYTHPVLAGKPASAGLEGYIFPETHFISSAATVEDIIHLSLDELQKHITQRKLEPALAGQGLTPFQGITLASIIEKEVSSFEERRQAAQVFLKRLKENMPLASDPTYKYAAAQLGVAPTTEINSPYNTYKVTGLPPGPIANFTIDSLAAVADPAPGDYLYFVSGDDGITRFSRTLEEHEQNIQLYCQELCSSF